MSRSNRVIPTPRHPPQKNCVDFPKNLNVAVC